MLSNLRPEKGLGFCCCCIVVLKKVYHTRNLTNFKTEFFCFFFVLVFSRFLEAK